MKALQEPKPNWSLSQLMELRKSTFFNFKVVVFPKSNFFFFIGNSQAIYNTLRKESILTKCVNNIAYGTKTKLAKNFQLVNSKATNPKFKN